jgi:50S ribosomal protein L16 3-hydroxylase
MERANPQPAAGTSHTSEPMSPERPSTAWNHLNLGSDPARFLKQFWQKQAVVVRRAFDGAALAHAFGSPAELLALARSDALESRLIRHTDAPAGQERWTLQHGPLERLPGLRAARWTVLLQGLETAWPQAATLLNAFRFLPDARLDDLMLSIAGTGGGVGPHVDSYDVFLIQVSGLRRWRFAAPTSLAQPHRFRDAPIKLIAPFKATHDEVLGPGDMLYLPPGWAHDGVAQASPDRSVCMTASIGFRAPSANEFLGYALPRLAESLVEGSPRFSDPTRSPTVHPAQIPPDLAKTMRQWIQQWRPSTASIEQMMGEFLTEPKPHVWFEGSSSLSLAAWRRRAAREGLRLDSKTRCLYNHTHLFLNGEAFETDALELLKPLADRRALDAPECAKVLNHEACVGLLRQWTEYGWLCFGAKIAG